jgi:hypothetical protein
VLDFSNNSPYIAAILAYQMGCRRIGLIGVDFTDNHCHMQDGAHELVRNGRIGKLHTISVNMPIDNHGPMPNQPVMPVPARSPEFNAAVMELGARVCTSRSPRCDECPIRSGCAWREAGYPETGARGAAKQARYAGSDRQARGALLKVLRTASQSVTRATLVKAWPDNAQRDRALLSLIDDGLVIPLARNRFGLPE